MTPGSLKGRESTGVSEAESSRGKPSVSGAGKQRIESERRETRGNSDGHRGSRDFDEMLGRIEQGIDFERKGMDDLLSWLRHGAA
jgi:hypothetical protein